MVDRWRAFLSLGCVMMLVGFLVVPDWTRAAEEGSEVTSKATVTTAVREVGLPAKVEFNRDIRPILSEYCYACHGPDASTRKGKYRLDTKAGAFKSEDGIHAIVPGKPGESELIHRVMTDDEEDLMPPSKTKKKLSAREKALLKKWVEQGANWEGHWSFIVPTIRKPGRVRNAKWIRNGIDPYVLARMEEEGLSPSKEALRRVLIRRVTFDLTGLPATPAEVKAFVKDKRSDAYERVVDRLLASKHYGEHVGRFWLDSARYGDTHGLHLDNYREMWAYRDYVVNAFNKNKRYDVFTIEQLAGDLLENATLEQKVATGFNRCNVTTGEGGSIVEEVYVRNVVDRVVTMGSVFMGLTMDCTRCHDHKFDPLTMKDFYATFAFFNNLDGNAMDGNKKDHAPVVRVPLPGQKEQADLLKKQLAATKAEIQSKLKGYRYVEPKVVKAIKPPTRSEVVWIEDAVPAAVNISGNTPWKFVSAPHPVFSGKSASMRTATGLSQHFFERAKKPLTVGKGDKFFAYVYLDAKNPPKQIMLQWNVNGKWEHRAYWGGNHIPWGRDKTASRRYFGKLPKSGGWIRLEVDAAKVGVKPGAKLGGWAFTQFDGTVYWDKAGIVTLQGQNPKFDSFRQWVGYWGKTKGFSGPKAIGVLLKKPVGQRKVADVKALREYFVEHIYQGTRSTFAPLHSKVSLLEQQIRGVEKKFATTLVFKERKGIKPAYMLKRGEYDKRGAQVKRQTPGFLPPMDSGMPLNRLGYAKWLVSGKHPLTARVAVNRFWIQFFGSGLVRTADDFGSQGEWPSHPALLDYLAVKFVNSGWDVKKLMKLIVTSATYRQSSKVTDVLLTRDPENRLLARGPRYRLDAEMLRDQALAVSGLLVRKMGGPSVKPPQPGGLWKAVGYTGSNTANFRQDKGPDKVYRRSLYTFWKRTAPPPQMSTFDAPSRELCVMRRERTNTPMQALLLMNDPQYVEAARVFAQRAIKEGGKTVVSRVSYMFELALSRKPSRGDIADVISAHGENVSEYRADVASAKKLIAVGESKPDATIDPVELAAWTLTANLVLNLDEVINKN